MNDVKGIENTDPVQAAVATALKELDGRQVAMEFTPDGEVPILRIGGKDVRGPLPFIESSDVALIVRPEDVEALKDLYGAICQVRTMPRRTVPISRGELIRWGATKASLRRLGRLGLLQERVISLVNSDKKPMHALAVVYPTPLGRTYIRDAIDPAYEEELRAYEAKRDAASN